MYVYTAYVCTVCMCVCVCLWAELLFATKQIKINRNKQTHKRFVGAMQRVCSCLIQLTPNVWLTVKIFWTMTNRWLILIINADKTSPYFNPTHL